MSRKVFISVLGTGLYENCCYFKKDKNFESEENRFIQAASLQYLGVKEEWSKEDIGLFLLTKKARKDNWDKSITEREKKLGDKKEMVEYKGLEKILEDLCLPVQIKDLDIPDGNNEEEIWEIFTKVFDQLKDDDELYFDVTHAFRYLPMLILVLCNYSKFLKNIKVMSITYGNYEARDKKSNKAPIIDLLPLTRLQDWTYAAGTCIDSGNVDKLVNLSTQELQPILREARGSDEVANNLRTFIKYLDYVIEERQTCRGIDIIKSQNFRILKQAADRISTSEGAIPKALKPLVPVIGKIKDSFAGFDENENISNGYFSARWCFNNKLYQQAATILQEVVVSYFCKHHKIDLDDYKNRGVVNDAFHIKKDGKEKDEGYKREYIAKRYNNENDLKDAMEKLESILEDNYLTDKEIINTFVDTLSNVRNDYNHSGMRDSPKEPKKIVNNIKNCLDVFEKLFLP